MTEQDQQRQLDELLDSLLATYSDVEPRPGMETRLRAVLRTESQATNTSHPWPWRWWMVGAGAAALAAVVFAAYLSLVPAIPEPPRIQAAGAPSLLKMPVFSAPPKRISHEPVQRQSEQAPVSVAGVRQEVFPARTQLSDQERLLMRYLAGTPREEVIAQSRDDETGQETGPIAPQIQPFTSTEGQSIR